MQSTLPGELETTGYMWVLISLTWSMEETGIISALIWGKLLGFCHSSVTGFSDSTVRVLL